MVQAVKAKEMNKWTVGKLHFTTDSWQDGGPLGDASRSVCKTGAYRAITYLT